MAIKEKLTGFFQQCVRVWHVLRKPSSQEFKSIAKISALGILAVGLLGFIISVLLSFVK